MSPNLRIRPVFKPMNKIVVLLSKQVMNSFLLRTTSLRFKSLEILLKKAKDPFVVPQYK
jgi:hypothetical protein